MNDRQDDPSFSFLGEIMKARDEGQSIRDIVAAAQGETAARATPSVNRQVLLSDRVVPIDGRITSLLRKSVANIPQNREFENKALYHIMLNAPLGPYPHSARNGDRMMMALAKVQGERPDKKTGADAHYLWELRELLADYRAKTADLPDDLFPPAERLGVAYDRIVFDDKAFGAGSGEPAEAVDGHPEVFRLSQAIFSHLDDALPRAEFFEEQRRRIVAAALKNEELLDAWKRRQDGTPVDERGRERDPDRLEIATATLVARLNGPIDQAKEKMKWDNRRALERDGKLPRGIIPYVITQTDGLEIGRLLKRRGRLPDYRNESPLAAWMACRIADTLASTGGPGDAAARMGRLRAVDKYRSHLLADSGVRQMRQDFEENSGLGRLAHARQTYARLARQLEYFEAVWCLPERVFHQPRVRDDGRSAPSAVRAGADPEVQLLDGPPPGFASGGRPAGVLRGAAGGLAPDVNPSAKNRADAPDLEFVSSRPVARPPLGKQESTAQPMPLPVSAPARIVPLGRKRGREASSEAAAAGSAPGPKRRMMARLDDPDCVMLDAPPSTPAKMAGEAAAKRTRAASGNSERERNDRGRDNGRGQ